MSTRHGNAFSVADQLQDRTLFRQDAYINGQWIGAKSGSAFEVVDPTTNAIIGTCPEMNAEEVDEVVKVSQNSVKSFQHTHPKEGAKIPRTWYDLMIENQESLAKILMYKNGQPIQGA